MPEKPIGKRFEFDKLNAELTASQGQLAFAIGKFSIEFASLEQGANHAIAVFLQLKTNKIGDLLFAAIRSVSSRLDILQSLVAGMSMNSATRAELMECVGLIRDLNSYRNWLLHEAWGSWSPILDEWQKIRPRTDKKLHYQSENFTSSDIIIRANECFPLRSRLSQAMKDYSVERDGRESSDAKPE